MWIHLSSLDPNSKAIQDDYNSDTKLTLTYSQVSDKVRTSASAFRALGVGPGDKAALIGENSAMWLLADHGIQMAGGASAVRGAEAPCDEIRYIYEHSDSVVAVMQGPKLVKRMAEDAEREGLKSPMGLSGKDGDVKEVVLLNREKYTDEMMEDLKKKFPNLLSVRISFLSDLLSAEDPLPVEEAVSVPSTALATIVYTSGTTGRPKGVMLTHSNLLHQLNHRLSPTIPFADAEPMPGDTMLSLLPVWHITERTFELWQFSRGCNVVYSSIRTFKNDLAKHRPQWMVLVPRVLEKVAGGVQQKFKAGSAAQRAVVKAATYAGTRRKHHVRVLKGLVVAEQKPGFLSRAYSALRVAMLTPMAKIGDKLVWSKVKAGFGGRQKVIISGGSALSASLEEFYDLAGITIVVGYGLTETSPLVAHRRADANLIAGGCVGIATYDTELKIVDEITRRRVPDGDIGVVLAKGPQVMKGYYKNPEATKKAVDEDGFFDTGDLGKINCATGDLLLTGRCKDTIVLSNGENIEPQPLEDSILSGCDLLDQVMLMGDDGRRLVAVCVVSLDGLVDRGLMTQVEADKYRDAVEVMNDPRFDPSDVPSAKELLKELTVRLQSDKSVVDAIQSDLKSSTGEPNGFRKWETVKDAMVLAEPFAMSNGLLTQSFKVKRNEVANRYGSL